MAEVKLTEEQVAVLTELRRRHLNGGLTGRIAKAIWGIRAKSDRVRRPCIKMEKAGLVRRHETNCEWWYITSAGRAAIASMETVGGGEHG